MCMSEVARSVEDMEGRETRLALTIQIGIETDFEVAEAGNGMVN